MDAIHWKTLNTLLETSVLNGLFSDGKYEQAGKA